MKDYSLRIVEVKSAQSGVPNTYMLIKIESSTSRAPVTTVPYTFWDELRMKLSAVGVEEGVLQDAKESLDLTGAFKMPEFPLSEDQLAQLGL